MQCNDTPTCPHCGQKMDKWALPDGTTWQAEYHYVCFNDECSYFVQGWQWMYEHYKRRASYRHCVNPKTGASRPLPVWSVTALKDRVIKDN
ncbi:MAG: hypothetical protein Kow0099_38410 [Candidatus Abyssubacteria bacterium]